MLKRFLIIFVPVAALMTIILWFVHHSENRAQLSLVKTRATNHVKLQNKTITTAFRDVVSDLLYLSEQYSLTELLDETEDRGMKELSSEYMAFAFRKEIYDQIRYIDEKGLEVIRVNYNDGEPFVVPESHLQNKENRYYFKNTISLGHGEVFVSPFDLNVEEKKIEYPIKPVIRFATPVFDSKGNKRGIMILNVLGARLIEDIKSISSAYTGDIQLLNSDGYWMVAPSTRDEWGFMFLAGKDITFQNSNPDAWKTISSREKGQFLTPDGLFTFCTVYPLVEARISGAGGVAKDKETDGLSSMKDYRWKLVSKVENSVLESFTADLLSKLEALYAILVTLLALGSWYLAKANLMRAKSEESLRTLSNTIEQASEMVLITDTKGVIEYVNPATMKTTGYSREELIGAKPSIMKSGKHAKSFYQKIWKTITEGNIWTGEVVNKKKWGELYYSESTISPVIDNKGKVTHFASIQRDVTARKRMEKKLRESENNLRKHVLKIENALSRAGEVQRCLAGAPRIAPYFVISTPYRNYKMSGGGDSIRWISFTSKYSAILLHDVSGHDIEELLLNILTTALSEKYKIITERKSISLPSFFLNGMNRELKQFCEKTGHYVTAVYALLDFENRYLQISLAGHPKQWLISPDGSAKRVGEYGLMMGAFKIPYVGKDRYIDVSLKINSGELLFLYSDGLMEQESRDGMMFHQIFEKNIIPKLAGLGPDQAHDVLKEEFERLLDGRAPEDDVSFVFVGTRPVDKYKTIEFFPSQPLIMNLIDKAINPDVAGSQVIEETGDIPDSTDRTLQGKVINDIAESYMALSGELRENGWSEEKIGRVESVLSELVENAIAHGNMYSEKRPVKLIYIIHDGVLEASVTDEGYGLKRNKLAEVALDSDPAEAQNRGFHVVSALADEVYFSEAGRTIWVMFDNRE